MEVVPVDKITNIYVDASTLRLPPRELPTAIGKILKAESMHASTCS
jgi:hypothetical protein